MANRNDEILATETEQRKLSDRLAELRKAHESVRPIVEGPYRDFLYTDESVGKHHVRLGFDTLEQAEKAKAILEKMEFGDPPFRVGERVWRCNNYTDGTLQEDWENTILQRYGYALGLWAATEEELRKA